MSLVLAAGAAAAIPLTHYCRLITTSTCIKAVYVRCCCPDVCWHVCRFRLVGWVRGLHVSLVLAAGAAAAIPLFQLNARLAEQSLPAASSAIAPHEWLGECGCATIAHGMYWHCCCCSSNTCHPPGAPLAPACARMCPPVQFASASPSHPMSGWVSVTGPAL